MPGRKYHEYQYPNLAVVAAGILLGANGAAGQVSVLTANYDNQRTNANTRETQLTAANVAPGLFGKLAELPVDGAVYSQPLLVAGLGLKKGETKNVLFVSTMHNSVYAFDADSPAPTPIWRADLGLPVPANLIFTSYSDIGEEAGVLSTGAIDAERRLLYVVSESTRAGRPAFYLHALDLATGAERLNGPAEIAASVTLADGRLLHFDASRHLQRPGLLLANGAIYIAFGSVADKRPFQGWILIYEAASLKPLGAYIAGAESGAGIWQSGRGLAADDAGNVYAITGDGIYDGLNNFGQSFLKLSAEGSPKLMDWYTPADWATMGALDGDLSAGPALVPGSKAIFGADKFGFLYLLDSTNMGHLANPDSGAGAKTFMAVSEQGLIFNFALWPRGANTYAYLRGARDVLRCFEITGNGTDVNPTPVAQGTDIGESARVGLALSANGDAEGTGVLWETSGGTGSPGTLQAYDASGIGAAIWSSDSSAADRLGAFTKFATPTVANGKVYVPTSAGKVVVYGPLAPGQLDPPRITGLANAASYAQGVIAPGELVTIFGSGIGPASPAQMVVNAAGQVSTALRSTRVLFDGVAAPVTYASPDQVSAVAPFGLPGPVANITVQFENRLSAALTVGVEAAVPGVFTADSSGTGQALAANQDGSPNSATNPAPRGSVVTFYATGVGQTDPPAQDGRIAAALSTLVQPFIVTIDGLPAAVTYAGAAPGMVEGVVQVNVLIPEQAGPGAVSLVFAVGGKECQAGVRITVK